MSDSTLAQARENVVFTSLALRGKRLPTVHIRYFMMGYKRIFYSIIES